MKVVAELKCAAVEPCAEENVSTEAGVESMVDYPAVG